MALLLLLLLLLLLVAAAPPSRALTVGYFSDSNCTHLAATRTTWTGFCQAGLAVADCWDLPAGSYSNGESLAAPVSWAVLEEFAGGTCPDQRASLSASSRVLRAYAVDASSCTRAAEQSLWVRVLSGKCSVRSAQPATVAVLPALGYSNYTTAAVYDSLQTGVKVSFFTDAACRESANTFSFVA